MVGPANAITVDAIGFAVSVAGLLLCSLPTDVRAGQRERGTSGVGHDMAVGVRFLRRTLGLRELTLMYCAVSFCALGLIDLFIFHVRNGLGRSDHAVGLMLGIAAIGVVLGAVAAPAAGRTLGFGRAWLCAYALCGLGVCFAALSDGLIAVVIAASVFAFGETLAAVCSRSFRQTVTPADILGRVTSAHWTINGAFGPLGAAILTLAAHRYGVRGPLAAVRLCFLATVLVGWFTPVRRGGQ